jgi:hypothetical protein
MLTASDITSSNRYPLTVQTRARPIPVFPLVPGFFAGLNHVKGCAVFDGAAGIKTLEFGEQLYSGIRIELFDFSQRRIANGIQDRMTHIYFLPSFAEEGKTRLFS